MASFPGANQKSGTPLKYICCIGVFLLIGIIAALSFVALGGFGGKMQLSSPGNFAQTGGGGIGSYSGQYVGSLSNPNNVEPATISDCLDKAIQNLSPGSPLKGIWFAQAGKNYNVNPAFLIAIANKETSLANNGVDYTRPGSGNNGGRYNIGNINKLGGNPIFINYNSFEDGTTGLSKYLASGYLYHTTDPKKTIRDIAYIYCPPAPDQYGNTCNTELWIKQVSGWINTVNSFCPNLASSTIAK